MYVCQPSRLLSILPNSVLCRKQCVDDFVWSISWALGINKEPSYQSINQYRKCLHVASTVQITVHNSIQLLRLGLQILTIN